MFRTNRKCGMTLTEVLVVLSVLAVFTAMFHSVFVTSWVSFQDRITRANLWQDSNMIMERMTSEARAASTFEVILDDAFQTVVIRDAGGGVIAQYTINISGNAIRDQEGKPSEVISERLNFANSSFALIGTKGLNVNLSFFDQVFGKTVSVTTSTEIFARN